VTGAFIRIETDAGGGRMIVLRRSPAAPEESYRATDEVLVQLGAVSPGTTMTLVSYVGSSMSGSGASPPFSCLEL
jgi:hypothetical protein